ncbi:MAG TPA: DUF1622 domain-containing protein [Fibrobacteria bacterium]|nr:DUF1622 domain-containing protein [Fibrobacteria bacterium]
MEEWVERMAGTGALCIEALAGVMIVIGALRAGYHTAYLAWVRHMGSRAGDPIRLELGKILALALEFLVGADILRTAVSPTWDQVGKLASIVAIRSALNYFLERERLSLEAQTAAA